MGRGRRVEGELSVGLKMKPETIMRQMASKLEGAEEYFEDSNAAKRKILMFPICE